MSALRPAAPRTRHSPLATDPDERWWSILGKGFAMGSADVVPGVSGGTVAFLLGIYGRLIDAVRAFDVEFTRLLAARRIPDAARHVDWLFLVPLAAGIVLALVTFTRIVPLPVLLTRYPETIYAIFFGLILGSCITLLGAAPERRASSWLALVIGFSLALPILTAVPKTTPDTWWFLVMSGALALSAMILPGVSGSFVLLILGKYGTVLDAIGHLDLAVLVPFLAGGAVGFASFARLLSWLIHRFENAMIHAIIGVLLASLWVIWPFQRRVYAEIHGKEKLIASQPVWPEDGQRLLAAVAIILAAGAAVIVLERLARRR